MIQEDGRQPGQDVDTQTEFSSAFAQAASVAQAEEAATEQQAVRQEEADLPTASEDSVSSETDEDSQPETPDYKTLFERESQRLRSFEGRVRKERESWRRQEAEYRNRIQVAGSGLSDQQAVEEDEVDSPATREPAATSAPEARSGAESASADAYLPLLEELRVERHRAAIAASHPDWREIASDPALDAFIDAKPAFMAEAMRRVVREGEAGEVVALLDEFKRETGRAESREIARPKQQENTAALVAPALAVPARASLPPVARQKAADYASAWSEAARARR